jgi:hypothetical protein
MRLFTFQIIILPIFIVLLCFIYDSCPNVMILSMYISYAIHFVQCSVMIQSSLIVFLLLFVFVPFIQGKDWVLAS